MAVLASLGAWELKVQPPLLLIVREQIKPASQVVYDRTETEIRRTCQRWGCPNAYIALTASPREVWWLTAWSSQAEIDRAGALYKANAALEARLAPLNARKRSLTDEPVTTLAKAAGEAPFSLAGARFVTVTPAGPRTAGSGAVYALPDGRRIALEASAVRPRRLRPGGVLLTVQPKWSLPPPVLADADPAFWKAGAPGGGTQPALR